MTTTPEQRTATLSELVAQEIGSQLGRRRWSQARLARRIGKTQMWVSLRMRGLQPIDLNDMALIAAALDLNVLDLMPRDASRLAGSPRPETDQNASYAPLIRSAPHRTAARSRHTVTGGHPFSPPRRDSSRPVSAVAAHRRRPTPSGPVKQPIPA